MRVALAQINPTIADFEGNSERILDFARRAGDVDLIIFPELALTGYPPLDLLDRQHFVDEAVEALDALVKRLPATPCILGTIVPRAERPGKALSNAAVLIHDGRIETVQHKRLLPTYDVFDEARYFEPGRASHPFTLAGKRCGMTICEDLWNDEHFWEHRLYEDDPASILAASGVGVIVNCSASPFHVGKFDFKQGMLANSARKHGVWIIQVNTVGGNDSLIFGGGSCVLNPRGETIAMAERFEEDLTIVDLDPEAPALDVTRADHELEDLADALALGVRDYFRKCGFSKAVIGLSGGIDSAVTAAVAVQALGRENVLGVLMPGPYSSEGSVSDSVALAENLGIDQRTVSIKRIYESYLPQLQELHPDASFSVVEENLQARIRGNILMAISNREGRLVLTTGNKSEMAVGYCTLYGDMSGALAVIGDVPKMTVYGLARYYNQAQEMIPDAIITKPPSAELAPDQRDEDSLPPYPELDAIISAAVEDGLGPDAIVARGHDPETVRRVLHLIHINEYKRQQAAPVLKTTPKAFGIGRRYPIAKRFL